MKITIDTTMKQIVIDSAHLNDLELIKKAIKALGLNPDDFTIQSDYKFQSYPVYPYPLSPTYVEANKGYWLNDPLKVTMQGTYYS